MTFQPRRHTVTVTIGGVKVGSDHPVVVQSMTNTDTADAAGRPLPVEGRPLPVEGRPLVVEGRPLPVDLVPEESAPAPLLITKSGPTTAPASTLTTPTAPTTPPAGRAARNTLVGTGKAAAQARAPSSEPWSASPAMTALFNKMRMFETLIARGHHAKAAIVASDIRHTLEHFDPVTYLPQLFAEYFKALHRAITDIAPYWQNDDTPAWHALEQVYRTDLDAFLDE